MIVRSARWGVFLLVAAALVLLGMGAVVVFAGPQPSQTLTTLVMPIATLVLGIAALFAGHVSYPRVQNLRVYLAGYSVGLQSIAYALLVGTAPWIGGDLVPAPPVGFAYLVYALALLLSVAYTVVRPFPTFRTTRLTTWILLGVQIVVLVIARFVPVTATWVRALVPPALVSWHSLGVLLVTAAIIVVNASVKPQSFYLRGAISGLALLAGGAWVLPRVLEQLGFGRFSTTFLAELYASVVPLFLIIAILAHVLARMEHRVSYDPLLQIYNRQYANQVLGEQSSISTRPPFTVMMIDIDHFKTVNDTYGHQAGDRILFSVAQEVQKAVVPEGIVCRYGGEELIVFVPGRTARDVVPLAQRLRAGIEQMETVFRAKRITVTVSIGLSDRTNPKHPLSHIVHAADKALYIAKENGRNQVRLVRIRE
jgi:diguanylate cyclase (GGDEF)-like protein